MKRRYVRFVPPDTRFADLDVSRYEDQAFEFIGSIIVTTGPIIHAVYDCEYYTYLEATWDFVEAVKSANPGSGYHKSQFYDYTLFEITWEPNVPKCSSPVARAVIRMKAWRGKMQPYVEFLDGLGRRSPSQSKPRPEK
jgi:hypothetical protein